jgi:small subunit ribosomal protein S9
MTQRGVERIYATGRRKSATARVFLSPGTGQILINKRSLEDYFRRESQRMLLQVPLDATATAGQVDLWVTVRGGGPSGQAGAVRHGIARALEKLNPDHRVVLKKAGLLTRDSRIKERKKYGQRGARARFQFSKR